MTRVRFHNLASTHRPIEPLDFPTRVLKNQSGCISSLAVPHFYFVCSKEGRGRRNLAEKEKYAVRYLYREPHPPTKLKIIGRDSNINKSKVLGSQLKWEQSSDFGHFS